MFKYSTPLSDFFTHNGFAIRRRVGFDVLDVFGREGHRGIGA